MHDNEGILTAYKGMLVENKNQIGFDKAQQELLSAENLSLQSLTPEQRNIIDQTKKHSMRTAVDVEVWKTLIKMYVLDETLFDPTADINSYKKKLKLLKHDVTAEELPITHEDEIIDEDQDHGGLSKAERELVNRSKAHKPMMREAEIEGNEGTDYIEFRSLIFNETLHTDLSFNDIKKAFDSVLSSLQEYRDTE